MTKLYRIEGAFRQEGEEYECDVHSYGTLEVCTVPGAPEECDVDLEYVEIEGDEGHRIEVCDLPEGVVAKIEDEALERLRAGDYKEVCLIGTKE